MTSPSRAEFEAWYVDHMQEQCGLHSTAEQIAAIRNGAGYGPDRAYLNACWFGWQGCAAHAARVEPRAKS